MSNFYALEIPYCTESCAVERGPFNVHPTGGRSGQATPQGPPEQVVRRAMEVIGEAQYQRDEAGHLVATLDRTERQVLRCLVQGMPDRQIATMADIDIGQVQRARASLMKKLDAR